MQLATGGERDGRGSPRLARVAEAAGIDHEDELVRQALARSSRSARARLSRLRRAAGPIAQAAVAAAAAWVLARLLPGHSTPFFAPIAAIITLTATRGRRVRHA